MTPDEVRAAAEQLVRFRGRFAPLFGEEQAQDHAYDYVKGLMVDPERMMSDPLNFLVGHGDASGLLTEALDSLVGHGDASGLRKFVNSAPWQSDDVQAEVQAAFEDDLAPSAKGAPAGVVGIIDESAIAKRGVHSAGVARQHNARLGKGDLPGRRHPDRRHARRGGAAGPPAVPAQALVRADARGPRPA